MTNEEELTGIPAPQRILLLPHCLRRAATCEAAYNSQGLVCRHCNPDCPVSQLTDAAERLGYGGVCVAPGGRLALSFVKATKPKAVVAVACEKELEEGILGIQNSVSEIGRLPLVVVIPLTRDGCIDTETDIEQALAVMSAGCESNSEKTA